MIRQAIQQFLTTMRALDDSSGWHYFLDALDVIQVHREKLRGAEWPKEIDALEVATYRGLLVFAEDRLRHAIITMPLSNEDEIAAMGEELADLFSQISQRGDAVVERLGSTRLH